MIKKTNIGQANNSNSPSLSICVCTYNRADFLRDMLAGLLVQELLPADEILVINNNCTDHTSLVIAEYAHSLPIREVFAPQQGLSHARNWALDESRGDAVIFFDDDVLTSPNVISAYRQVITENPGYGFFGGKITIAWPQGRAPSWWSDHQFSLLDGLLVHYDLGSDGLSYAQNARLPYGANFAVTQNAIDRVGFYNTNLGVVGAALRRGEDSDYFERALHSGIAGMYVPDAIVAHRFEPSRLKLAYLVRYGIAKGKSASRLNVVYALWLANKQALFGAWQWLRGRRGNAMQCSIMVGIHLGQIRPHSPELDEQP